jgi:hypothetical protein
LIKTAIKQQKELNTMINSIRFNAKNLTSNAGVLPLLNYTTKSGVMQYFNERIFEKDSIEQIKLNHIKTLLCAGFIGLKRLNQFEIMKNDPQYKELGIDIRSPEAISRFLKQFDFRTTQMLRCINFSIAKNLIKKADLKQITIDIDSRSVNVEGNQGGAVKGYNPERKGNNCYNILYAFCNELKSFVSGFMRSGDTYTSNATAELIKEIISNFSDLSIVFRMDSGYFDEEILQVIENSGNHYVIKGKLYKGMVSNLTNEWLGNYTENKFKLASWEKERRFCTFRVEIPQKDTKQIRIIDEPDYEYFFFVTNMNKTPEETHEFYNKRGNAENYIKETKYDMNIGSLKTNSFWANEAYYQLMMTVYNIFLLFKFDNLKNRYREQINTFRSLFVHVAGKIVKTGRRTILQISEDYPFKEIFNI